MSVYTPQKILYSQLSKRSSILLAFLALVRSFCLTFFLSCTSAFASTIEDPEERLSLHLHIRDFSQAESLALQIEDPSLKTQALIEIYARSGKEKKALDSWKKLQKAPIDKEKRQELLESLCWGILQKGRSSPYEKVRSFSLIGAAKTTQVKAIPFLKEGLKSSNPNIRYLSCMLVPHLRDDSLQKELRNRFYQETHPEIQLCILRSLTAFEQKKDLPFFRSLLANPDTSFQVQEQAAFALAHALDSLPDSLTSLQESPHRGLRLLFCYLLQKHEHKEALNLLLPLLEDDFWEVQVEAIYTLAFLPWNQKEDFLSKALQKKLSSPHTKVALMAAWALALHQKEEGLERLKSALQTKEEQEEACAIANYLGAISIPLSEEILQNFSSLTRLNLATAFLKQQKDLPFALKEIRQNLLSSEERLEKKAIFFSHFPIFVKSSALHHPFIKNYPQVLDQFSRLELIGIYARYEPQKAKKLLKDFLRNENWGISASASSILIQEGSEDSLKLLKELLKDPNSSIRLQAALVLASLSKDKSVLPVFFAAYGKSSKEIRYLILESLGSIGDKRAIPFLEKQLFSPFRSYRVLAAASLIQCINS